jgi:hypothetical protein
VSAIQKTARLPKRGTAIGKLDGQVAIEFDAQSGATSDLDLSDRVVWSCLQKAIVFGPWKNRRSFIVSQSFCDQFNDVRIYPSLRLVAVLPHFGFRRGGNRHET